jgi:hypothetical protein
MSDYLFNENDYVGADVTGPDNVVRHESWDSVDLIESGYTLNDMLMEYKKAGNKKIVITVEFGA